MPFPKTVDELITANYTFIEIQRCSGRHCEAVLEFWRTPQGKRMPLDVDGAGNVTPHFSNCIDVAQFRR